MLDPKITLMIVAIILIVIIGILSFSYIKAAFLVTSGFYVAATAIGIITVALSGVVAAAMLKRIVPQEDVRLDGTSEIAVADTVPDEVDEGNDEQETEENNSEEITTELEVPVEPTPPPVSPAPASQAVAPEIKPSSDESSQARANELVPKFSVWKGYYKGFDYNFIEVENGTPYVYVPSNRGNFQSDLNNIASNRESGNIVVMANAGMFNNDSSPRGTTIQNGKILSMADSNYGIQRHLVVDEFGNVGYTGEKVENGVASYVDARTGAKVENRKIISSVFAFSPILMNGKIMNKTSDGSYVNFRARQIFCVKQNSYMIITNTGEGEAGGGWNFDDMVNVANYRGCLSAFNLDGGGSTATAYRTSLSRAFTVLATTARHDPTFIVFTSDNLAPRGK